MTTAAILTGTGLSGMTALGVLGNTGTPAVAGAGTNQAGATPIGLVGFVSGTAGASADGFVLPTVAQGSGVCDHVVFVAVGATTAKVYPGGAETCNGSTSAVSVAQNKMAIFYRSSATNWGYIVTA